MNPTNIFTAFYNQGGNLAALITPYSLRLLYLLLFVEVATIAITWMRGNDDIPDLLWRVVYLLFSTGFAFWWITNSWTLGKVVLGSFHMIGQNISGVPDLTPSSFLDVAGQIFNTLWNSPSSTRLISNLGLSIAVLLLSAVIFLFLALVAVQHFAVEWTTMLAQHCGAVLTTLPSPVLGAPPKMVTATACTTPIPTEDLSTLFVDALLVCVLGLGIPTLMAAFAGSGIHLALEHLASAKYLGGSAMRSVAGGFRSLSHQISRMRQENNTQNTLQERMKAGADASARTASSQAQTPPPVNAFGVQPTQNLNGGAKPTTRI